MNVRGGDGPVVESALAALQDNEQRLAASWLRLEALIKATDDPRATCVKIVQGRRQEMHRSIAELWTTIDGQTAEGNRRAEHYEAVSLKPAPPSSARAVSDRVMAWVRQAAARPWAETAIADAIAVLDEAKQRVVAHFRGGPISSGKLMAMAETEDGELSLALRLMAMQVAVMGGAVPKNAAIAQLRTGRDEMAAVAGVHSTVALYDIMIDVIQRG